MDLKIRGCLVSLSKFASEVNADLWSLSVGVAIWVLFSYIKKDKKGKLKLVLS